MSVSRGKWCPLPTHDWGCRFFSGQLNHIRPDKAIDLESTFCASKCAKDALRAPQLWDFWPVRAPCVDNDRHPARHIRHRPDVRTARKQELFMRQIAPLAAALIASLCLAGPAGAQGTVRSQHGDWQMSCDLVPGALEEQCALIQNVTAEDQPNVALSVIALKTA